MKKGKKNFEIHTNFARLEDLRNRNKHKNPLNQPVQAPNVACHVQTFRGVLIPSLTPQGPEPIFDAIGPSGALVLNNHAWNQSISNTFERIARREDFLRENYYKKKRTS